MALSAAEQYLLELTNRARLDPLGEAARFGIDLNQGVSGTEITATPKFALAPNARLDNAAEGHSAWMLDADVFSHTGQNGTNAGTRMETAGYSFTGNWSWGENLAWMGSTGRIDHAQAIAQHHEGLFRSAGHRVNTLSETFREVGIAQVLGAFTTQGQTYNASMTTLNFARSGTSHFVTGVAYTDSDRDGFYSIGEGTGQILFQSAGARATTSAAGGYGLGVDPNERTEVSITANGTTSQVRIDTFEGNAKLDLVGTKTVLTSADLSLISGPIVHAQALGTGAITLTGNAAANTLTGNDANNRIDGGSGYDLLRGLGGADTLTGGWGNDTLFGGGGNDALHGGAHNDRIFGDNGNDRLAGNLGRDTLFGGNGADTLWGHQDHDQLMGGSHNDALYGGYGNDRLEGQSGNDKLWGEVGNDTLLGQAGDDRLWGGDGDDRLNGGYGNDSMAGGAGQDVIAGGAGHDRAWGQAGNDRIAGNQGSDRVWGQAGNDQIWGNLGNDFLYGGTGRDRLWGNEHNDLLDGGRGNDTLVGGTGADRFVFKAGTGQDTVLDFTRAQGDRIVLDTKAFDAQTTLVDIVRHHTTMTADGLRIDFDDQSSVLLAQVDALQVQDLMWG